MKAKNYCVRVTEEEYKRYLKSVEEMEQLILIAQASCERVERMKIPVSNSIRRAYELSTSKVKKFIKISNI